MTASHRATLNRCRASGHAYRETNRRGKRIGAPQPNDGLQGLAPVEPRKPRVDAECAAPDLSWLHDWGFYELAIVEFDDQGRCYDRGQMDAVAQRLDSLAWQAAEQDEQDVIQIVFVARLAARRSLG